MRRLLKGVCRAGAVLALLPATAQGSTSTAQNPVVVFDAPGDQAVTLEVCNDAGCATVTKTVRVLDPNPHITSVELGMSTAEVGQPVSMNGAATGRPLLLYTWDVRTLGGVTVATVAGSSAWLETTGLAPGDYTVTLNVSNVDNTDASSPLPLTVQSPPALDFYTLVPCRLLDTRGGLPLTAGTQLPIAVVGNCGIPAEARAIAANVTVVAATETGYVSVIPGDALPGSTSTVTFGAQQTRASFAVLPLARDGSGTVAAVAGLQAGSLHLVLDVTGYFRAPP